jgi:hypothetical protein
MKYLAHTAEDEPSLHRPSDGRGQGEGRWQLLKDHLRAVPQLLKRL